MKRIKLFLGTLVILMLCTTMAMAQSKSSKSKKKASASDKKNARKEVKAADESIWNTKMWYGADINYPSINLGSFFYFGANPRAAYKFNNMLSAGAVVKMDYLWAKIPTTSSNTRNQILTFETVDLGIGAFARARLFRGLYLHAETNINRFIRPNIDSTLTPYYVVQFDDNTDTYNKGRYKANNKMLLLGAGWSSGFGKWQSQIAINRNLWWKRDDYEIISTSPWQINFGITYNF